jgi:uncharacterized protein YndB with AHSA1/START domain
MNDNRLTQEIIAPVVKTVIVNLPLGAAFRLFTAEINRWWPLESHSVFGDDAAACSMDCKTGGRIIETHKDGRETEWGAVLAWEPPSRLVFSMYPGRSADTATEVEVTFEAYPMGGTRVTLTHRGWENYGGWELRENYNTGWDTVLRKYTQAASQ